MKYTRHSIYTLLLLFILLFSCASVFDSSSIFNSKTIKGSGNIISKDIVTDKYSKIDIYGSFDVKLVKGNVGQITLETDDNLHDLIIIEAKNDRLTINNKNKVSYTTKYGIKVTVPFEDLSAIKLGGSSVIKSDDIIKSKGLTVSITGSGTFTGSWDTEKTNLIISGSGSMVGNAIRTYDAVVTISGSGNVALVGDTSKLILTITGSGDFNSFDFNSKNTNVTVTGSGTADVVAQESLEARVIGSGDIKYKGEPTTLSVNTVGSGSISKK